MDYYDLPVAQITASQQFANAMLLPCVLGWSLQVFIGGMAVSWGLSYRCGSLWRTDTIRRKLLLVAVLGICLAQIGQNMYLLANYSTTQQRSAIQISRPTIPDSLQPLSVALAATLVQSFLAERATRLLRARWAKWTASTFFAIVIVCELTAAFCAVVMSLIYNRSTSTASAEQYQLYAIATATFLWCGAVVDVGVSGLLVLVLRKRLGRSSINLSNATDRKLQSLSRLAVLGCSITTCAAVAGAVAALAIPEDLLYSSVPLPFWYLLSALYPISLISALSSRKVFSTGSTPDGSKSSDPSFGAPIPVDLIALNARRYSYTTKHPLSPTLKRPTSRYFAGPRANDAPFSPVPIVVQVQVQKVVAVESSLESGIFDESVNYNDLRLPELAKRRREEDDVEGGMRSGQSVGVISGRSERIEAWEEV